MIPEVFPDEMIGKVVQVGFKINGIAEQMCAFAQPCKRRRRDSMTS